MKMRFERPVLIIFHGATGEREAELMMAAARLAAARTTARAALRAGFEAVIVATDDDRAFDPAGLPGGVIVDRDIPGEPFDYASRLRGIIERYGLQRPAVMGSGSVPLLGGNEFAYVVEQLDSGDERLVTNNFFSADFTAWRPGHAILQAGAFTRDNVLPRRLRDLAGLQQVVLPRTTASQFDLDTPVDLAVLGLQPGLAPELAVAAQGAGALGARLRHVMPLLCNLDAQLVVAGRVSSQAWEYLRVETACRVRMYSEERGLATAPEGYVPRSALGFLLEAVGFERFFEQMAELGDALILDTRVLEAHAGVEPSREDRFQSDLMRWERIQDPWLRSLTRAAANAPRPVLLGGHTLVAGGLMALNDVAWAENDRLMGKV